MTRHSSTKPSTTQTNTAALNRRQFLHGTLATASASVLGTHTSMAADTRTRIKRKIKLGVIGNGGRGAWIANLFKRHGGYEMHAVADYFQETADRCGDSLGVSKSRRYSTLSGYMKLIESGVEAVVLETPPYFFPEHARAAVKAGLHVYMAKPVAVDVPGALQIEAAAKQATRNRRCFLVDYQMPTDPANTEVLKLIHTGGFGEIAQIVTTGICDGFPDPPGTSTLESRLRGLVWVNDIALGCDYIGNFDIHAIDAGLWAVGQRPVAAMGASSIRRPKPHGDGHDVCSVVFDYADGLVHNHYGQALRNQSSGTLSCRVHGQSGNAAINYWGDAEMHSFSAGYKKPVEHLYEAGATRNIAAFHENITNGHFNNKIAQRAVDGVLTCILGREAATRRARLTMDDLIRENKRLEVDLSGLKT